MHVRTAKGLPLRQPEPSGNTYTDAAAPATGTARRWWILRRQIQDGHEPCFSSDARYVCREVCCRYRGECLQLRADWLR